MSVDDAGGYVSGEILANETDYDNSDGDAEEDPFSRRRRSREADTKKMLPLSSDDSEPDEGKSPPAFYRRPSKKVASKPPAIGPPQKLSKSLQRRTPTATIPSQRLSSDKTPSYKDSEISSFSGDKKIQHSWDGYKNPKKSFQCHGKESHHSSGEFSS